MKYVEAAGARLSVVGLGTWQFGSGEWGYGAAYASSTAPAIVERSLDLGVNLIDTAEIYGFGRSERIVGRAVAGRRADAFLATKLLPVAPFGPVVPWRARGSLRRLGVESVDLYQLHSPNPLVPIRATMAAMAGLRRDGLIRHVGVSNFSLDRWMAAERALLGPVVTNQVRYSLIDRRPERDLLPWAQEHGRIVMAYSPLAQGLLSGRYDEDHPPRGMRARSVAFRPENLRRAAPLLGVLRDVAAGHGVTSAQVALAWLVRRPNVVVIPGASSVEQAESNARAAEIELTDDEDAALTGASDAYRPLGAAAVLSGSVGLRARRVGARVRRVAEGLRS